LPRSIGRYTLYEEIALGGMGMVHLGVLTGAAGFRRPVAFKHLHDDHGQGSARDELRQEAWLGSRVRHPNVVSVLDLVEEGGTLYLVMEFVVGETLAWLNGKQNMPLAVVVAVLSDVLQGLHAAHTAPGDNGRALGIVHRDVSPQNILVGADGITRILDFGVAKCSGTEERLSEPTEVGFIKGKLGYIAPEQLLSEPLDARTDVFAAGVVLWEALTGRRLFKGLNPVQALMRLGDQSIPPPSAYNRDVTPKLDAVLARALASNPQARLQSAEEFAEQLRIATERAPAWRVARHVEKTAPASLTRQRYLLRCIQAPRRAPPSRPPTIDQSAARGASTWSVATNLLAPRRPRRQRLFWHEDRLNTTLGIGGLLLAGVVYCLTKLPPGLVERRALGAFAQPRTTSDERSAPVSPRPDVGVVEAPGQARGVAFGATLASAAVVEARSASSIHQPEPSAHQPEPSSPAKPERARAKTSFKRHVTSAGSSCNPPYRVDSEGIRRLKRGCL
jgi:serine/threonine-protein kinase